MTSHDALRSSMPPGSVAYLVNRYPKISHSFIRREIAGVEASGVEVIRVSIRGVDEDLPTEADRQEQARTRVLLERAAVRLPWNLCVLAFSRPRRWARALTTALRLARRSERGWLRHLAYFAEACVLCRWLDCLGVRHLHAHFGTNPAAVALLCRQLGGPPYSFTVHGTSELVDAPTRLGLDDKVAGARFVATVCHHGREELGKLCAREHRWKIRVVHCGLDRDFLDHPIEPAPPAPRLVSVARFSPEKGHSVLLDGASRLAREGLDFQLVLIGDGDLRGAIEAQVREAGLQDRVRLTGWLSLDAVRDAIIASRALVVSSFGEGLPVVIMEALALNRPVVSTRVGGIAELVEPGVSGWLVPPGSATELAAAMREALTSRPETLESMGAAGRQRVLEQHDARVEAGKLVDLFRDGPRPEISP
jgi:glycosyltransferase involved in cell wall biosynthesis